jgi:hypothetical protein
LVHQLCCKNLKSQHPPPQPTAQKYFWFALVAVHISSQKTTTFLLRVRSEIWGSRHDD